MRYKYTHICALPVLAALGMGIVLAMLPMIGG
jgi:hypothetical protein